MARARKYLGNQRVNAMWRAGSGNGKGFLPVTGWGEGGLPPFLRYALGMANTSTRALIISKSVFYIY